MRSSFLSRGDKLDAVTGQEFFVIGMIDGYRWIVCRAVLDPLTIDVEVHQLVRPVDLSGRPRRDQDLLAGPPVPRIDDEVMDAPIGVIDEEILDVADLAVAGIDMIFGDGFDAAQMSVVATCLGLGDLFVAPPCSKIG
jgi:hypothetical protein